MNDGFTGGTFRHLRQGFRPPEEDELTQENLPLPTRRMRRLRYNGVLREMVSEHRVRVESFVMPLFVCPGEKVSNPIHSMPGCSQLSIDLLVEECRELLDLGVKAVILFGIPESKDGLGSSGYDEEGIIPKAIEKLKVEIPELLVWADVCMCEYTSHGHCGIIHDNDVDNDATLEKLTKSSVVYAHSGADVIAPSDMMDGRVAAIRHALDRHDMKDVPICSYAAKYASAFYGPFRDAADSAPQFGDRRSYQMNPANSDEAMHEVALDIDEGADIIMVKPALAYLDIIQRVKSTFRMPTAAYNVSGEYAMLHAAAEKGWIDKERVMLESLLSMTRAGADIILTYHAKEAAKLLQKK